MHRIVKLALLPISTSLVIVSPLAHAEAVADAETLLRKGDVAAALRVLEDASADGNVSAKGKLAEYLRGLPPPYGNVPRACALAREAADAGDAFGAVTRAECLITGAEKADEPIALARQLARSAQAKGSVAGGFVLYEIFLLDPKYSYSPGGKVDMNKYNALAATPVAQRGEQIEALNGLASAVTLGHQRAVSGMLGYLIATEAPRNLDRVIGLVALMQRSKVPSPKALAGDVQLAQQIKQLGTTQTSVTTFKNTYSSALLAAALQIRGIKSDGSCDVKDIKLTHLDGGEPIANADYLPLDKPLEHSYLVQGSWAESWTFSGCDKTVTVTMAFTADGWGGAQFRSNAIKPSP